MSCPKCGSGAVFQGRCRECGTVVDPRRASSAGMSRSPSLEDDDGAESTVAEPRGRRPDPDATLAPPGRRPGPSLLVDPDEDHDRTHMPPAVRRGPVAAEAPTDPPPRPARASQSVEARPRPAASPEEPAPLKPMEVKDRSSWYKEAGIKPPPPSTTGSAFRGAEDEVSITAPTPVGGHTPAAAILFAQAAAGMLGVFFGLNPIGLVAGGVALIAGILLLRGVSAGKFVAWLAVGVFVAWSGALAVSYKLPGLAVVTAVPPLCLAGALLAEARSVRSALGGIGVAIALVGLVVPALSARRVGTGTEAPPAVVDATSYQDDEWGVSVRMPASVSVWSREKDIRANLPAPWPSAGLKLGFATSDSGFVGGLLQTRQPRGGELRNLLAPLSVGSAEPPTRNERLVPDGLRALETEGWELTSKAGELMVVLARTPDGRAFTLFGIAGAAKGRNLQLFKAIGDAFEVRTPPAAE